MSCDVDYTKSQKDLMRELMADSRKSKSKAEKARRAELEALYPKLNRHQRRVLAKKKRNQNAKI